MHNRSGTFVLALSFSALTPLALAQIDCDPTWSPGTTQTPIRANITDSVQLPNGDIVVIGDFQQIAGVPASRIARWNGTNWFAFGQGLNAVPSEIELHPAGGFVVSGAFTQADGLAANHIARWDGSSWSAFGTGIANNTTQLAVAPNGNVYVLSAPTLYRWDGASWSTIPAALQYSGFPGGSIDDMLALQNNNLVVGGFFTAISGLTASNRAEWNGTAWIPMGTGQLDPSMSALGKLAQDDVGNVYAATYSGVFGSSSIQRWNGSTWTSMGTSGSFVDTLIYDLKARGDGQVIVSAVTDATQLSQPSQFPILRRLSRWNGTSFVPIASDQHTNYLNATSSIELLPNGNVLALGSFTTLNGRPLERFANWNGTTWSPIASRGSAPNNEVHTISILQDGRAFVGGSFSGLGDARHNRVGIWNGSTWTEMGTPPFFPYAPSPVDGFSSYNSIVKSSFLESNGNLLVSGEKVGNVVRWNGSAWTGFPTSGGLGFYNIATGFVDPADILAINKMSDGSVVIGGSFNPAGLPGPNVAVYNNVSRHTGSDWGPMGNGLSLPSFGPAKVYALTRLQNGDLIAAGTFSQSGTTQVRNIARWSRSAWEEFAGGITGTSPNTSVRSVILTQDNAVIAAGLFTAAGGVPVSNIARKTEFGTTWQPLGTGTNGQINVVFELPNRDLLIGGSFTTAGGVPVNGLARWNGIAWSAVGTGVAPAPGSTSFSVYTIARRPNQEVLIGGNFESANGNLTPFFTTFTIPPACRCDSIDFNNDGSRFDPQDIDAFLSIYSEGTCIPQSAYCNDIDFNNDTSIFDPCDVNAFLLVYSEGPCTPCGL